TWQGDAGPNETPIPAICAPDGSLIYLIDAGEAIYERDFHLRDGVTVREDYLGIDHLALEVSDLDAVQQRLAALGYPLDEGPIEEDNVRFLLIRGPDGERLEFDACKR
ncbi:hypothetical protein PXY50_19580, partial [Acinetobacter baumannii]|nr:hypothetical protein [Acinetobacter baumannii]